MATTSRIVEVSTQIDIIQKRQRKLHNDAHVLRDRLDRIEKEQRENEGLWEQLRKEMHSLAGMSM